MAESFIQADWCAGRHGFHGEESERVERGHRATGQAADAL